MTIPPYARLAAKLLKRDELGSIEAPPSAVRADAVAAIERALVRRAQARTRRGVLYVGAGIAAAAALVGLGLGAVTRPNPERPSARAVSRAIRVHRFGDGAEVFGARADGALEHPGARVKAQPHGRALLAFTTGTRVTLEEEGDLSLVENGAAQVLALDRGALRADVAKLGAGQRFLVQTADAEIEVHGTSFRVSVRRDEARCPDASLSEVVVYEGVVAVRSNGIERHLGKGEHWSANCPSPEAAIPSAPPRSELAQAKVPVQRSLAPQAPRVPAAAASSTLTAQNDVFAAAIAAHRAGDRARALRGFEDVLARFPDGPLAESAAVQRLKLLAELDRPRARNLAREYLARYRDGFARELAVALAAETP